MVKPITYRAYPLEKPLAVNGRNFTELIISSHYEEKHRYMTDEKIMVIVGQLEGKEFTPKLHKQIDNNPHEYWQSFKHEPFFYEGKAHRLVWYWESNRPKIWVLHCFRRKKYE